MDQKKLLALAASLGLSQAAMAAHLGISKTQVGRWSMGTRPIPQKHQEPLWDLIQQTFHHALDVGQIPPAADHGPTLWVLEPPRSLAIAQLPREQIFEAVTDLGLAHAERRGEGPTAVMVSVHAALAALLEHPKELRKPANTLRLLELCRQFIDASILLAKIAPLQNAMEENTDANNTNGPE